MATVALHASPGRRHRIVRSLTIACLLCLLLVLCGCAQKVLPTAVKLGQAGQEATKQIKAAVTLTDEQLIAIHKFIIFHNAISDVRAKRPIGSRKEDKYLIEKIDNIQKLLVANTQWLSSLQNAYSALGALASYDASENFVTAFNALSVSTTSLLKTFGSTSPPAILSNIFSYAGSSAVDFIQTKKVIAASQAIQIELDRAIAVLSEGFMKIQYTALQEEYITAASLTTMILVKKGVLSIKPLATDLGSVFGAEASSDADKIVREDLALQTGFGAYIMEVSKIKTQQISQAYDKSLETLRALKKVHADLEAKAELDLTQVAATIDELQNIVAQITVKTAPKEN